MRAAWLVGIVGALAAVTGCFSSGDLVTQRILTDARRRREPAISTPTTTPTLLTATATASPTRTPRPGRTLANIRRVWDGNTILLDDGYSVRYIGVDTPGAGMFRRPLEPFGREAAERNLELVEGKVVELEEDARDVDAGGFLLRYVYVGDLMVNEALLRAGLARLAPMGANVRYAELLGRAEEDARRAPVNIWTLITPTPTPTPTPPDTPTPTSTRTVSPNTPTRAAPTATSGLRLLTSTPPAPTPRR